MSSRNEEPPHGPAQADMILLALFQSRLRERSLYLGEEIRSQRGRLSAHAQRMRRDEEADEQGAVLNRLKRAEQALAAVQQAQERIGHGRYGLCDECQEPIAWDDLLAAPEQTTCRACCPFLDFDATRLRS